MRFPRLRHHLLVGALALFASSAAAQQRQVEAVQAAAGVELRLDGTTFHSASGEVRDLRLIELEGSATLVALWEERDGSGLFRPHYAISLDGRHFAAVRQTSYELMLRRGVFDPLQQSPDFSGSPLTPSVGVYIVQYVTQPLAEYTERLEALGASVHDYLPYHAQLVAMEPRVRGEVADLPFVRWVGAFHPEYRMEEYLLANLTTGALEPSLRYLIRTFGKDELAPKERVASVIRAMGGTIDKLFAEGILLEATLTPEQLMVVASLDEVQFIDRWGEPGTDMDIAREFSGANHVEIQSASVGQGVRGECMDTGVRTSHSDFTGNGGILIHTGNGSSTSHGTSVTGVVFGAGSSTPGARGDLPNLDATGPGDGQIVFAAYTAVSNRKAHTLELTNPALQYKCVFQTNSWGSPQTTAYTNDSAQMDDIIFDADIVICQSQSNTGTQSSRPQAWAKNIVSVGGIRHQNTLTDTDDSWGNGASIGPAQDGRIKPDLAHFYDSVLTSSSSCDTCTTQFSGTSAATPITAGYVGLFHQLWHQNTFASNPGGSSVFESKPHFETAKAALINTATQWRNDNATFISRFHQGWGRVDAKSLYDLRTTTFFVDREMVDNLATRTWSLNVPAGTPAFKATMVYRDPPGTTTSTLHRKNDLSLRLTSPTGTMYWGNNGLTSGKWSTAGGSANDRDTVENVFVQNPQAGSWTLEVIGADVNTDLYAGVPGNNADFSLWVTGVVGGCFSNVSTYCTAKINSQLCLPAIGATGSPSTSAGSGFVITGSQMYPDQLGTLFYGTNGQSSSPFQGGFLCVQPPTVRTPVQNSGGSAACSGVFAFDFNFWIAGGNDPALVAGTTVNAQYWSRDPSDPFGSNLSDGVEFTICD